MDVKFILNKIKLEQNIFSDADIADYFKVSPSAVSNWRQRGKMPLRLLQKYCNNNNFFIDDYFKSEFIKIKSIKNNNKKAEKELTMNQQEMLIRLQAEKIQSLEKEIIRQEPVYDGIQSDIIFSFEVRFNWSIKNFGVKVKYLSQDSTYIPLMAKKLGYTESEITNFLQVDELVEYKNHKIHQLRTEKQKEEMLGIMDKFMKAYRTIKMNTTMLVAEIPVLYTHKNGTVYKSNVEYRINWVKGSGTAHIRWCNE
jgi:transcriptional regulator with XRE-family HTH domain